MTLQKLNITRHRDFMFKIIKDIFKSNIGKYLALKGGTLLYLLYKLDRFSTDLDFDLIGNKVNEDELIQTIKLVLNKYGKIKEEYSKYNTIFFLFSYGIEGGSMNIKIEINKRIRSNNKYEIVNFFGQDINAMDKDSIVGNKIVALTDRKKVTPRDLFDIGYFLKNGWIENNLTIAGLIKERKNKEFVDYIDEMIEYTKKSFTPNNILNGLGDLIDETKKGLLKSHLIEDVINGLIYIKKFN